MIVDLCRFNFESLCNKWITDIAFILVGVSPVIITYLVPLHNYACAMQQFKEACG